MSDNTRLNRNQTEGDVIGTDEVDGVKYQRVKLIHGGDGVNKGDVSITNGFPVRIADGASSDAFGRLRVSEPLSQFDWTNLYRPTVFENQQFWDRAVTNGTVSANTSAASVTLSTGGTTDNNHATIQTKSHFIYQPGKSRLVMMTFVMGAAVTNGIAEIGYGNASDGIFLQRSGSTLQFVRRTSVSGSVVDNPVTQANWNLDPMDGTGSSGVTIDLTKTNILVIDLEWLGVGRVRCGFNVDGVTYYAHEFRNSNSLSVVYMLTGSLPVRYRVENDGTASGTLTIDAICSSVISEGGYEIGNYPQFSASTGASALTTSTTLLPLISIRPATAFNGQTFRGHIVPSSATATVASQVHEYQIVKNGSLSNASWSAVDSTYSAAQFDVAADGITGGIVLDSGYIAAAATFRASGLAEILGNVPILYSSLNNTQETFTLAIRTVTGGGTAYGNINWREVY